jgi:hypothetical protein
VLVLALTTDVVVTVLKFDSIDDTALLVPADTDVFALSNFGIFGKLAMTLECVLRNDKTSAAD